MTMKRRACVVAVWWLAMGVCAPHGAAAQYADSPRTLAAVDQFMNAATQIGRRLFVGGLFSRVSVPTGGAVVVDTAGAYVPDGFPRFDGPVNAIVADGLGGWVVVGGFTRVAGQAQAGFARVRPDRTVDPRYRLTTDGPIGEVAIAHGRVYLAGSFTTINGVRRSGLAALDVATGALTSFAAGFDVGSRAITALSVSSIGVYASGWVGADSGRLWGFDATSGTMLFEREAFVNAIAASSTRVYVGGFGSQRPVWAVDPRSGQDVPWSVGLAFQYLGGTYGDYTSIGVLLLDGGRLYLGGNFQTLDGRAYLAAVDAASGQPLSAACVVQPRCERRGPLRHPDLGAARRRTGGQHAASGRGQRARPRQPGRHRCAGSGDELYHDGAAGHVLRAGDRPEQLRREPLQQRSEGGSAVTQRSGIWSQESGVRSQSQEEGVGCHEGGARCGQESLASFPSSS
jgi:hypothetical protein